MIKRLIIKIRLSISKFAYRKLKKEIKFKIGDIVVAVDGTDAFSPWQDVFSSLEKGEVVNIFMGTKKHEHKDWYYSVVFTDASIAPPYSKTKVDFNHWEIRLDTAFLREKRLKEILS